MIKRAGALTCAQPSKWATIARVIVSLGPARPLLAQSPGRESEDDKVHRPQPFVLDGPLLDPSRRTGAQMFYAHEMGAKRGALLSNADRNLPLAESALIIIWARITNFPQKKKNRNRNRKVH